MAAEATGSKGTDVWDIPQNTADGSSQSGDDVTYDFSCLPEPIWVKIMEYLYLSDQYHVSTTCHTLYNIFNHPSNWKSVDLILTGGHHNFGLNYVFIAPIFKIIVEKFGDFFQRLTISVLGHLVRMKDDVREILVHMSEVCRLEHLVLEVGLMTSDFHLEGIRPLHADLKTILMIVNTAFRLKKLEILSWPMFPEVFESEEINVFEAMKKNPKLDSLESLSLFWMKNKQWTERMPLLPSPQYTISLISHFRSLQCLSLRSPMLCNELIQELASSSRTRLTSLRILLSYVAHDPNQTLPEIASSSWLALQKKSPKLKVEYAIISRIPDIDLATMLKPEVPLAAVKILKYARCSQGLLSSLTEKYKRSLESFICYCDPSDCEKELLKLVEGCTSLDTLAFHGQIHYDRLLSIVRLRSFWKHFEFVGNNILTESAGEQFDDDTVVGRGADGDLVLVGMVRFHGLQSEEERQQKLFDLCVEVSKRMHYSWKPC